ncbi:hypothetical protein PanWU01x14_256550 [Parasponia andersonii]|uniref:Uncharacterized protein n=1 Tax=Parasponia andersonii TaxID=3476 RepID=A0A2P5BAG4_PARAD|nr:hypothetical protein PanWU01x14_256550 [Parasponia andersonii]
MYKYSTFNSIIGYHCFNQIIKTTFGNYFDYFLSQLSSHDTNPAALTLPSSHRLLLPAHRRRVCRFHYQSPPPESPYHCASAGHCRLAYAAARL